MGLFGWSYPPGCSGPPEDQEPHPKSEEAQLIMENAGVDQEVINKIIKIIDDLAVEATRECPRCLAAFEEELKEC